MKNSIDNILFTDRDLHHLAIIKSKKGTVRSNHYHRNFGHFLYVLSGSFVLEERDLTGRDRTSRTLTEGQIVFTSPCFVHKTTFLEDTVLLSLSEQSSEKDYAADTIKEKF
jgi:dTDP-4-dehydrorhamnose 3,5-epimerase-like enzyme